MRLRHVWFYFILRFTIILLLVTVAIVDLGLIIAENSFQVTSKVTENYFEQVIKVGPNIQVKASKKCVQNQKTPTPPTNISRVVEKNQRVTTVFAITHTRKRLTQLLDLTSMCQSLMNVKSIVWIIVENTFKKTAPVSDLLNSCKVNSVHLLSTMYGMLTKTNDTDMQSGGYGLRRGAKEKNMGLEWIRRWCQKPKNCSGVVYFLDDESKFDLRLFDEMRKIQHVGVWPVGFAGKTTFQGPVCKNGSSVEWHTHDVTTIPFPISSLGFAVNLRCLFDYRKVLYGYAPNSSIKSTAGWEESDFLSNFLTDRLDPRLECRGSDEEVYVWQVKSQIHPYLSKHKYRWKYKLRT